VDGLHEVEQTRGTVFGDASTGNYFGCSKQVRVFDLLASAYLASKETGLRSFDFLSRHSVGQNGQWMTQIDHFIEAVAKEIGGFARMGSKNAMNTDSIEFQCGSFEN
jgi:hypothetical protein